MKLDRHCQVVFTIDIAAYAIMSNHYHLVLHINNHQANDLSDDEVIDRWLILYKGLVLIRKHKSALLMTESEKDKVAEIVSQW